MDWNGLKWNKSEQNQNKRFSISLHARNGEWNGMKQNKTERNRMKQNETEWNGLEWIEMEQIRTNTHGQIHLWTERNGRKRLRKRFSISLHAQTERNGMGNGMEWNGMEWNRTMALNLGGWKPTSLTSVFSVRTSISVVPSGSKKWMSIFRAWWYYANGRPYRKYGC